MAKNSGSVSGAFGSWAKATELRQRIVFTLLMLVVYRLGTYIPLPGIDLEAFKLISSGYTEGLLGLFDLFSGGALGRMTIFALNIVPYITASIVMQLLVAVTPSLMELRKEGEAGRKQINQYTRYLTAVVAFVQSIGVAVGLESMTAGSTSVVIEAGWFFKIMTALNLTAGTFFVLWIGEKITERGLGNGVSLIIFSGIVANLPFALATLFTLGEKGSLSAIVIILVIAGIIALIYGIVYFETAQRRILIRYPKRQVGFNQQTSSESSYLPLKINNAGVIPPIFASSLLLIPTTIISFLNTSADSWLANVNVYLGRGSLFYFMLYATLIVFFAFFYVSVVFNSKETSENLKNSGGVILGVRPGDETANYLEVILKKLTVIGAAYLVVVCLLPEFVITKIDIPFYLGGTSLLIVVSVTIDTITQAQSYLMASKYESVLKKAKLGKRK